jgi:hypothetical protein
MRMSVVHRIKWGILGCVEIAERAFIPAVLESETARCPRIRQRKRRSSMRFAKVIAALIALALVAACSSTYKAKPELTYYHGQNVPPEYLKILKAGPDAITFEIRIEFEPKRMYHLVLDGNEPVAQGWFSTLRAGGQAYTVTLKPETGKTFEAGKTYRLCIGAQSPADVQMTSSNYRCQADYTFVFQEKR